MRILHVYVLCFVALLIGVSYTTAECSAWHLSQSRMRKAARADAEKHAAFWKKFDAEMAGIDFEMSSPGAVDKKPAKKKAGEN